MRLRIENIGVIENADIEISGLTVIAGDNDSGKSTVGKIAYSLTKSFEDFEKNYEKEMSDKMDMSLKEFYNLIRENIDLNQNPELVKFARDFRNYIRANNRKLLELIENNIRVIEEAEAKEDGKTKIDEFVKKIEVLYKEKITNDAKIKSSIVKTFMSEFSSQIINLSKNEGFLEVSEGENIITSIIFKDEMEINNFNTKLRYNIEGTSIENDYIDTTSIKFMEYEDSDKALIRASEDEIFPFDTSIFIETPFILTYKEDLKDSNIYHVRDLLYKLMTPNLGKEKPFLGISEIILGEVFFDYRDNIFLYQKNLGGKKVKIQISNAASGIKSLGILQILESVGEFNKRLLLIIDEPEVHLHPNWQVEYAKILIKLAENGVKVLITTHSPYFVQAINKHSKKSRILKNVRFYLSELKHNGNSVILDKTRDKDEIFDKLSKPFEKLVFGE